MPGAIDDSSLTVSRYKEGRFWAVREAGGTLVCVCVYRKGAREVVRRISHISSISQITGSAEQMSPMGRRQGHGRP